MNKRRSKKRRNRPSSEAFKIIVEKHADGYVAYPLGLKGVVVGDGDTYEEAMADVKSAIRFHIDTFGNEVLEVDSPVLEAFVAEAEVAC
jgi:predicted RNase H-like HicB family nuclease